MSDTEGKQIYQLFVKDYSGSTTVITIHCTSMDEFLSTTRPELKSLIRKRFLKVQLNKPDLCTVAVSFLIN